VPQVFASLTERLAAKQAAREADQRALETGEKTREQLQAENGWVRAARIRWDLYYAEHDPEPTESTGR
jgi:hypothetical protein